MAPVFLLGESHGQRNLVGYSPWHCKRVRHDWVINNNNKFFDTLKYLLEGFFCFCFFLFDRDGDITVVFKTKEAHLFKTHHTLQFARKPRQLTWWERYIERSELSSWPELCEACALHICSAAFLWAHAPLLPVFSPALLPPLPFTALLFLAAPITF